MQSKRKKAWGLRLPDGSIEVNSVRSDEHSCWEASFHIVGDHEEDFCDDYWKEWDKSIRAAKKLGYEMVRVRVEEER